MTERIYRREFLSRMGKLGLLASGTSLTFDLTHPARLLAAMGASKPLLGIAEKGNPEALTRKAVELLGGMQKFVKSGDKVMIKPNLSWDRIPEQAANTNPGVLKAVIQMCIESGAREVLVADRPCNDPRRSYIQSGAVAMVKELDDRRVKLKQMDNRRYKKVNVVKGKSIKSWPIYDATFKYDKVISIPIAKHHSLARLTMSIKNIMGFIGGNRAEIHDNLPQKLVDINTIVKPDLIVLDCYRILKNNGPQGGSLHDVFMPKQVIAGTDPVAIDSYGATLFGLTGNDLDYLKLGYESGLGEIDLDKVEMRKANLG